MMRERVKFAADWLLSRVEASDEQCQKVKTIVQATVQDLAQVRDRHHENRQALLPVLAQRTIDRTTLRDIWQAELRLANTASERIVIALADVADVLTPEQCTKLMEFMGRWHQ
jgi:Spy/CpxP family protein refolding chaperone